MDNAPQPATERQRKLIDVVRHQLALSDDETNQLALEFAGSPMATLTRKGASALITELQHLKHMRWDRATRDI